MNWVNNPNGLCWFRGYRRLFYQSNPLGQEWNDIYWGHAVNQDLIHRTHMPYVPEPQSDLWRDKEHKGGAFSGGARVGGERIRLYLTRHHGPQEDGEETREWQTGAVCWDGIHAEKERPCTTERPEGASFDFRDPKVQRIEGMDYMVLESSLDGVPSILLYVRENRVWSFKGPLLQKRELGVRTFECPDFFELDGECAAAGARMCHCDETDQYRMTQCYAGTFDGDRFRIEYQQWYDFGSNFYAMQSSEHGGRRIIMGQISDFYGEHRVKPTGARGSFSLPRELHMEQGRLPTESVGECYGLLKERIFTVSGQGVPPVTAPGNSFFVRIRLGDGRDFLVTLAREGDDALYLERKNGVTSLVSIREGVSEVRFPSGVSAVRYVETSMDRRVAEVYLNHGETAGTRLFCQGSTRGHLKADFAAGSLKHLEAWAMESVRNHKSWREGEGL